MRRFVTVILLFASLLLLPSCRRKTATPSASASQPVAEHAGSSEPARIADEAAFFGRTEIAMMLLDKGADVFAKKNDGATPLTMAASHNEIAEMIQREIQLLEVAGKGDNAMVKELLAKGAYVNVRDPEGRTPLTEATWNNHVETVKLLLDKGANPNASKVDGATPLSIAASKRYKEIVELLKKAGAK